MKPTVINIRQAPSGWKTNPQYVYIGRRNMREGLAQSPHHNPYPLAPGRERGSTLDKYRAELSTKLEDPEYRQQVKDLWGKILVCWCKPHPCHGDVLAQACEDLNTTKEIQMSNDKKIIYWTGIGSRQTPPERLWGLERAAAYLAQKGFILRSGAAEGADQACERGCDTVQGPKQIFLPWEGFMDRTTKEKGVMMLNNPQAQEMAAAHHPNWAACSAAARKLHARNMHQILGPDLLTPSAFVLYWAPVKNGQVQGGTGQAIRLATSLGIPCYNIEYPADRKDLNALVQRLLA